MRYPDLSSLPGWWPYAIGVAIAFVDIVASMHVVIRKRDVRAAIGWVGLIWLVPGVGAVLYAMLGLNRIRRRATALHRDRRRLSLSTPSATSIARPGTAAAIAPSMAPFARLAEALSARPLLSGNHVDVLNNGDEAYPAMLAAIDSAQRSVALCTYIFGDDRAGRMFIDALARATARGVEVRVLVDGFGVRYTFPPVYRALRRAGVRTELFLPTITQAGLAFFNLRNHRKVLTVDGRVAFTGGMNIQARNIHADNPPRMVRDMHFRLEGPIVGQLQETFAEDWAFATSEVLDGAAWYPALAPAGDTTARAFTDGPDGSLEILRTLLMGALSSARESVRILTPYFLPDQAMIAALSVAALRGVRVEIILPSRVNIPIVQWAAMAQLWQVLRPGCRVFVTPPPFDHAKLMVVDRVWALLGSSNWDPRSLRLNFELDVECHDAALAGRLDTLIQARRAAAREVTLEEVDARSLPVKLRDGVARLASPYI
ncbi:MAG TPA: phospholipase D-like domain-containing protein [Gemmatimonadaceae bacterium]|nr:phospholipase D-like domain-containing protein [Gemmatimonadaceae bacterium]